MLAELLQSVFGVQPANSAPAVDRIQTRRAELAALTGTDLQQAARDAATVEETIAITAEAARRVLGQDMFRVQIQGAYGLAHGRIVEMQTGEGKTLAAVPAVAWLARGGAGVHVMTVNDYLARRDAAWMGEVYRYLGFTVGCIQQGMSPAERREAYACDITYSTANEIGFDYLRDQLALAPAEQVHRPFAAAVIDEADSILIDEARIPLVIAGGEQVEAALAYTVDPIVRRLRRWHHYTVDEQSRNVALTPDGALAVERALQCGSLYDPPRLPLLTAVQDALHAHTLLRRDVDYVVKNGHVETVDEFKGRIIQDRRWPEGLQTALEVKEGTAIRPQGTVLGSITIENLIALYPTICGMTGTAATQAEEFAKIYHLAVEVIPTNRPMIRTDRDDVVFPFKVDKERAVLNEIRRAHAAGQPVLVGTASVEESERLSAQLKDIPHAVLNARNDEQEAAIIAKAGERGAVTVSTNMAGRGVDIVLGEGVADLGGLYVIGTNRHESRRIDNQLRGRAGRQGDPGSSRFFISLQDDLIARYAAVEPAFREDPAGMQRMVEGMNVDIRRMLHKYEGVIEGQRQRIQSLRQSVLTTEVDAEDELERLVRLRTIDALWSEHLAGVAELRHGIHWVSYGGRQPLHEYLAKVHEWFQELEASIDDETAERLEQAEAGDFDPNQRGAVWTYLTTDQPFGDLTQRVMQGLRRKARTRSLWG